MSDNAVRARLRDTQNETVDEDVVAPRARRRAPELVSLLSLVRGLPFADSGYAWADAEGITSTFVWLVTKAIDYVCDVASECGDEPAILEATAAGLRMSPGDEMFLARRRVVAKSRV